jgi:hypothetical protein
MGERLVGDPTGVARLAIGGEWGAGLASEYLARGAPYGPTEAGLARWFRESVNYDTSAARAATAVDWWWCCGCQTTHQPPTWLPVPNLWPGCDWPAGFYVCPQPGCGWLVDGVAVPWVVVRARFPQLPAVPATGAWYPLSLGDRRDLLIQAQDHVRMILQVLGRTWLAEWFYDPADLAGAPEGRRS